MSLEAVDALVNLLYQNIFYNDSKYGFSSSQDPIEAEIAVAIGI